MSYLKRVTFLLPLAIVLNIVREADFALAVLKFVYQKDMSEHCRRRVMPSMFLGRHVMESQSQILHFSQLEVPYSCFVVVRTESGSNIILVLQIAGADEDGPGSDKCFGEESQVTVHELGETFGGYWGPLPEVVLPAEQPTAKHRYTRPTTTPTTQEIVTGTTEETTTMVRTTVKTSNIQKKPKKDYIRVEIPLVNVSGPFANDPDFLSKVENYDRMNDAMRSPGVSYHSTLLPLVQFSLSNSLPPPHRRLEEQAAARDAAPEPLYDLQFNPAALMEDDDDATVNLDFLMGSTTPVRRTGKKFRYNANKLRKFKKNNGRLFTPAGYHKSTFNPFDVYSTLHSQKMNPFSTKMTTDTKTVESWQYIEDLLKNLKNTTLKQYTTSKPESFKYRNISTMLQKIAEEPRQLSAYLDPNSWRFESSKKESTRSKQETTKYAAVSSTTSSVPNSKISINPIPTKATVLPITRDIILDSSRITTTSVLEQTPILKKSVETTKHSSISRMQPGENATGAKFSQESSLTVKATTTVLEQTPVLKKALETTKHSSISRMQPAENATVATMLFSQESSLTDKGITTVLEQTPVLKQTLETTNHSSISSITVSQPAENATGTKTSFIQESSSTAKLSTDGGIPYPVNDEVQNTEMPDLWVKRGYNTDSILRRESNKPHAKNIYSDKTTSISTGTMVDRESWQNVVQVAPAITDILNKSGSLLVTQRAAALQTSSTRNSSREKRFIHPIAINNARPHALTTLQEVATTSESIYQFSDIQDFAQLVELEDDNLYGRIALRYLDRYVGKLLFDLCEHNETKGRHVFLFNSSRIVIAINNFTLKRMTVVATPARTLMHADSRCDSDHIECQVSGARVCVDGMAACDGVPNCGAYDIYDEDRLRCGSFRGMQHSVVLAALVFLAVLMTLLYTVHYWLKRCVPRVSKAFFIYTNGSENVLYLDTVMRSPTDFDNESRLVYTSNIFDAEDLSMVIGSDNERKKSSFLRRICSLFTFRRSKVVQSITRPDSIDIGIGPLSPYETRKPQQQSQQQVHSLAELELSRMMSKHTEDIGVQTGESLEMAQKKISNVAAAARVFSSQRKRGSEETPRRSHDSELNLLQIIRNAKKAEQKKQEREPERTQRERQRERRVSSREFAAHDVATGEEEEMETTFYESSKFMAMEDSFVVPIDIHEDPKSSKKRLRFEENATAIHNEEEETTEERKNHASTHDEPSVEPDVEHGGREFMRFFGGKSKRTKKKSHPNIR